MNTDNNRFAAFTCKPLRLFGIGFYLAWVYLAITRIPGQADYQALLFGENFVRIFLSATVCLFLVGDMFIQARLDVFGSRKWIIAFAASGSAAGTALLILALAFAPSLPLFIGAALLLGLSTSILLMSWGELFSRIKLDRLLAHIAVSCPASILIMLGIPFLPREADEILTSLLPVLSGITLISCADEPLREEPMTSRWNGNLSKLVVACFAVGAASALVRSSPEIQLILANQTVANYLIEFVVAVIAITVALANRKKIEASIVVLYRISIPLLAFDYLLLALAPESAKVVFYAASNAGGLLFFRLMWLIYPLVILSFGKAQLRIFGWGEIAIHAGNIVGSLLHAWLTPITPPESLFLAECLTAAFFVFSISYFIFRDLDVAHIVSCAFVSGQSQPTALGLDEHLTATAGRYGLTPRETEVFLLLAKGRSLPYIEKELVISNSTAKTHVRHIYEKLGISTRQELHDIAQPTRIVDSVQ